MNIGAIKDQEVTGNLEERVMRTETGRKEKKNKKRMLGQYEPDYVSASIVTPVHTERFVREAIRVLF